MKEFFIPKKFLSFSLRMKMCPNHYLSFIQILLCWDQEEIAINVMIILFS